MTVPELVEIVCPRLEDFALFFEIIVMVVGKGYLVSTRVCEISFYDV